MCLGLNALCDLWLMTVAFYLVVILDVGNSFEVVFTLYVHSLA